MEQDYRPSKDIRDATVVISSTTTSLGTNLTLVDTALTQGDDYWNNMAVVILSGNSNGQVRRISDFETATDKITVDTAFASIIASGTKYNIVAQHSPDLATKPSATDIGVRQVFEKSITANANAGATVVGTVSTQACVIESIIIYADTNGALPASTTAATTDGLAGVAGAITFLDAGIALTANLDTAGDQVAWVAGIAGAVRLAVGYQIITTLAGGGANPTDLTFVITYYSSAANGGTIS